MYYFFTQKKVKNKEKSPNVYMSVAYTVQYQSEEI